MRASHLLIYLGCLGSLLLASCRPTEPVPVNVTGSTALSVTTAAPLPTTAAPAAATATPTPPPDDSLLESPTAATPTPEWTRLTLTPQPSPMLTFTAAPTPTMTATPPPLAGTVWRIQFKGKPCPDRNYTSGDCSRFSSDLTHVPSEDYIINSDGSDFATLAEAGIFLADFSYFELFPNSFSPDGQRIAFVTSNCINVSDLAGVNSICFAHDGSLPAGYRFLPDGSCLITHFRNLETDTPMPFAQVRVQKNCIGQEEAEIIGVFDFTDLPARPVNHQLSPQGDALLVHGRMPDGELRLYLQEINSSAPPLLLYTYPNEELIASIVAVRWQPDGSAIEFLLDHQPNNTFYRISRDGREVNPGVSLPQQFQARLGDWSPDGHQFAFSHVEEDGTKSGLYIIDLQTGEWRQILSGFHISSARVRTWSSSES